MDLLPTAATLTRPRTARSRLWPAGRRRTVTGASTCCGRTRSSSAAGWRGLAGTLTGQDAIGVAVGKVIDKYKQVQICDRPSS